MRHACLAGFCEREPSGLHAINPKAGFGSLNCLTSVHARPEYPGSLKLKATGFRAGAEVWAHPPARRHQGRTDLGTSLTQVTPYHSYKG